MFNRVMITFVAFALVALSVTARDEKKDDPKGDKDKLQGEWTVASVERTDGIRTEVTKSKLVVKDNMWLATTNGRETKATFKVDESKSPKEIDIKGSAPSGKEATVEGIYKLDGDTLAVCRPRFSKGGDRPKELKAGEGVVLTVYKRAEKK